MAPQQELEKLIPEQNGTRNEGQYGGYSQEEATSSAKEVGEDEAHVVIVQPAGENGESNKNEKITGKQKNHGEPQNCPQLETALFFFGIAGMIVSLVMLLQHLVMKVAPFS